ncbi:MAG: ATPase, T2SS/T4P/T4SS family [Albidovulum sp.]|uniref:ATPase, T2SS/T4P/T4SS family n=1 Tax=Albidovulum sp. TaxID=1872424 RepID=UPI003C844B8D
MTKARAHLRICDAYGNRRAVVALEESYYELGDDRTRRGEAGFIHLEGSGIEARHARLILRSGETRWQVVSLVSTGTKLGRQALAQGAETVLEDGAELWLGNNLLQLLDLNRSITEQTVMPELADIELMMNEALLDYEDRRRDLFDGDERQREALLSAELDRLLSVELDLAGKPGMIATINRYCKEALRRPLISACLMSGTRGDIELSFSQLNAEQRARAIELREELASELRLEMTALSTAADLRLVHDGFDAAYKAISGMIGETFKLALIRDAVREKVLGLFFRLGPIQFLLDVPMISEIMVCGFDRIFVEKGNRMFETGLSFASESELFTVAARIAGRDGKQLTEGAPMADARLPDGSRANIVASPTSLGGLSLTIRKFGKGHWAVSDLRRNRAMSLPMERFLQACVKSRKNIVISGGTGSGKTTLLNALAMFVPEDERIVTIEDTSELRLLNRNLVTLEARRANMDGRGEISIRDLVKNALRMRPDRIVVGECRGGETLDMLQAMNTGHSGSMTTAHANSPEDLILRLETMVLQSGQDLPIHAIRQQIGAAIDVIVQVRKTRSLDPDAAPNARQRSVVEIAELGAFDPETGGIPVNPIFEMVEEGPSPRHVISGYIPSFFDELSAHGLIEIGSFFDTEAEQAHAA